MMPMVSMLRASRFLLLCCLLGGMLMACATPEPPPPRAPEPAPEAPVTDPLTVIRSEDDIVARRAELANGEEAIEPEAAGYFGDVLRARLVQDLAPVGVQIEPNGTFVRLTLPGVAGFETGNARLTEDAEGIVARLALILSEFRATLVVVSGHTDDAGDRQVNLRLSESRARAVARQLQSGGVTARRLMIQGHGPDQAVADNETEEGRAMNRRVEVHIQTLIRPAADS